MSLTKVISLLLIMSKDPRAMGSFISSTRFGVRGFPDACRLLGLDVQVDENIWSSTEEEGNEQHLKERLEYGGYNQRSSTLGLCSR